MLPILNNEMGNVQLSNRNVWLRVPKVTHKETTETKWYSFAAFCLQLTFLGFNSK